MRGGKDEEKLLSPMFPRLHVNDTEKGGPRAPPRNKMALYEQLTIPTQRFSSGSASATPLPSSPSAPSTSSSHFAGHKRGIFYLSSKCSVQSHQAEKLHSYGSRGGMPNNEAKLLKTSLVATGPLSSSPQRNSVGKYKISNLKNFSSKNSREKDDLSIPASDQPKNDVHNHDQERMSSSMRSSAQLGISGEPQANIGGVIDLTSQKYVRNETEEDLNLTKATQGPVERPTFIPSATDKPLVEANTCPSTKYKDSEKAKQPHPYSAKENWTSISNSNRLFGANVRTYQEHIKNSAEQSVEALKDKVGCTQVPGLENSSMVIRESCSALSPRDGDRNLDNINYCSRPSEYKKFSTVHLREVERHDNISDASLVDSVPAPNISPDVVVGLIGERQFWKARKAIVHQQRIFAVQVFELHRLIKVQKLIAGSPHILLEDYLDKPPSTVSAVKSKPTECARQPLLSATVKDNHQLPNIILNSKCADKNPLAKLPLPSFHKDNSKLAITQQTSYELHLKDMPQTPTAAAPKSDPWCLNPPTPGNQWLVPVMSPSEGLIYKPYTGPCPPSAGFMAPMYGNYRSMNLNTGNGAGDFYNTAYAVPDTHQGFGYFPGTVPLNQTYFPPYGLPVRNQSMSGSAPDQMSLFARVKSKEQENQISTEDINYLTHQENSCEMPSQTSHAMSFHGRKFHGPKGSELQGSTASSPSERGTGDVLPLFPTEPAVEESSPNAETSEHKSRAIKVVPHHPTSATESAARIFQLIQEERKQL